MFQLVYNHLKIRINEPSYIYIGSRCSATEPTMLHRHVSTVVLFAATVSSPT